MSTPRKATMDGNEAAAHASYAFTEVAAIYPITPSSPMAAHVDAWSAHGRKNIFGEPVQLVEMQSEAGAVSTMHGAMEAGLLTSSYTSSQGLLLMIPTMSRIAGHLKSGVIHVAARSIAYHAYSIDAEHSDVMACRHTGFAMLASSSVQEAMDLGAVAHLASIKSSVPFMHFFDGFRTSHEVQKIDLLDYDDLAGLVDYEALERLRRTSLNPDRPSARSPGLASDVYFQSREACNPFYDRTPGLVEHCLGQINALTGRDYRLFNYFGDARAEHVIVALGSVCGAIRETVEHLNARAGKTGLLEVHLYRPFSLERFLAELPATVKTVTVLDRTKESGALGEPLYEDVCTALSESGRLAKGLRVLACRFGLGGRDTTPDQIAAVFANAAAQAPRNHFTIGINDDLTGLSLPAGQPLVIDTEGTKNCKFWGIGSDGTVGANKNTIKIIGDHTDLYVQAYFEYDGKKSGGVTKSHLRFGPRPILSEYYIQQADFVACHKQSYITSFDIYADLKPGGTLLLNTGWSAAELDEKLPAPFKRYLAQNRIHLYSIDATAIARDLGMGNRTNTILQAAFFKLAEIIPLDEAVRHMKDFAKKTYAAKGEKVVQLNCAAIERGLEGAVRLEVPAAWADLSDAPAQPVPPALPAFVREQMLPASHLRSNDLPVSVFADMPDGTVPCGLSKYDKRGIAVEVPVWRPEACLQCNQCSFVCPHSAIRPFLLDDAELAQAPAGFKSAPAKGKELAGHNFAIVPDPLDCAGCGSCAAVCPAKEKALQMRPLEEQLPEQAFWDYAVGLPVGQPRLKTDSVKGSQFLQPLLEFPGACPGCGETPYAKLVTQLYGDRMTVAAATGCSLVWASVYPVFPYTVNEKGHGPAISNSLFENNAEFGLGIAMGAQQMRQRLKNCAERLLPLVESSELQSALAAWLHNFANGAASRAASEALKEGLAAYSGTGEAGKLAATLRRHQEYLVKQSNWLLGGDGWAYDIGYGGLDHVLSLGLDLNVLVLDTEVYSNTGGQASKATQKGAVAQFAAAGRRAKKKDLGKMAMSYGNVYVAQVAMGASQTQLIQALTEAESYAGTSLIIAYAPCINHGILRGMNAAQEEMKRAVQAGYWHLYRYNPLLKAAGENPFKLDSKAPDGSFKDFLLGEGRFASLFRSFPSAAEELLRESEAEAAEKYQGYLQLAQPQARV